MISEGLLQFLLHCELSVAQGLIIDGKLIPCSTLVGFSIALTPLPCCLMGWRGSNQQKMGNAKHVGRNKDLWGGS
jgi:hypothetical protein